MNMQKLILFITGGLLLTVCLVGGLLRGTKRRREEK